jgi:hypothetical protein
MDPAMRAVKQNMKEILIENMLVRRVEALGGLCIKVQTIGRRGFFDRLIVLPGGRVVFCEVKRPKNAIVAAHQLRLHKLFAELGATVAIVSREGDIDRVLRPEN